MAIIEFENVTKTYGKTIALDNVSLKFEKNKIIGLLGPNGSGKTTMIKLANGLLTPNEGNITIMGSEVGKQTKAVSAYLPDRDYLPKQSRVKDVIAMYRDFFADFDEAKARAMMDDLGISEKTRISQLSKGTREKMQLCLVLGRNALVYWLDEPIGGVDPASRAYILKTLIANYNSEAAVVISTHLIADVEPILDDVVFIKNGNIILHQEADEIRSEKGMSVEDVFKEEFKC